MHLRLSTKKVIYDLELERRVTIIRGSSASGKTYLTQLLYSSVRKASDVEIKCERPVIVVNSVPDRVDMWAKAYPGYLVVLDEDFTYTGFASEFYKELQKNDCWILQMTRDFELSLELECSISSIKKIYTSGKYRTLVDAMDMRTVSKKPNKIWTEDTDSGFYFFKRLFANTESTRVGKSWLNRKRYHELLGSLLSFDWAVLGPLFANIYPLYEQGIFDIVNTDSFEKLLLTAKVFDKDKEVQEILEDPAPHGANDKQYYSWESFFEKKLVEAMLRNHMGTYHKSELPVAFTGDAVVRSILERNGLTVLLEDSGDRIKELRKLLPPSKQDISDEELLEKYGNML